MDRRPRSHPRAAKPASQLERTGNDQTGAFADHQRGEFGSDHRRGRIDVGQQQQAVWQRFAFIQPAELKIPEAEAQRAAQAK